MTAAHLLPVRVVAVLSAVLALLPGAAAQDSERPAAEGLLRVGERIGFHGRWMGIPVGTASIEVKELTSWQGRPAYRIEAEGHSNNVLSTFYPIEDRITSYLDAATLQPLRFEKHQREGRYRADEVIEFDHERGLARYESLLNKSVKEVAIPAGVHDIISVFYWLRTQPVTEPTTITVNVYADEKIYPTQIKVLKQTELELLRRGTFPSWVVEPGPAFGKEVFLKHSRLLAYVSTDARHLPLLLKARTPWGFMTAVIDEESL